VTRGKPSEVLLLVRGLILVPSPRRFEPVSMAVSAAARARRQSFRRWRARGEAIAGARTRRLRAAL